jgi:hypothetical protein
MQPSDSRYIGILKEPIRIPLSSVSGVNGFFRRQCKRSHYGMGISGINYNSFERTNSLSETEGIRSTFFLASSHRYFQGISVDYTGLHYEKGEEPQFTDYQGEKDERHLVAEHSGTITIAGLQTRRDGFFLLSGTAAKNRYEYDLDMKSDYRWEYPLTDTSDNESSNKRIDTSISVVNSTGKAVRVNSGCISLGYVFPRTRCAFLMVNTGMDLSAVQYEFLRDTVAVQRRYDPDIGIYYELGGSSQDLHLFDRTYSDTAAAFLEYVYGRKFSLPPFSLYAGSNGKIHMTLYRNSGDYSFLSHPVFFWKNQSEINTFLRFSLIIAFTKSAFTGFVKLETSWLTRHYSYIDHSGNLSSRHQSLWTNNHFTIGVRYAFTEKLSFSFVPSFSREISIVRAEFYGAW